MKRIFIIILTLSCVWLICSNLPAQPQIGTYPPQIHQQICQESTFTRYLEVFNSGNTLLVFTASLLIDTLNWVSAAPLSGEIQPGDTILIKFVFNSAGLPINNYYAYLTISSNDPEEPVHTVLAMLHVQDLTIFLEAESDSICYGCSTTLNVITFGCSEDYSYEWISDPPGFSSTEKSPVVSPQVNTTYTVTVTDGGGFGQKSVYIQVYGSSEIAENHPLSQLLIYPDPAHDQFTLRTTSGVEGMGMIRITDLSGRVVYSGDIEFQRLIREYAVNPGKLTPGTYILSIEGVTMNQKSILFKSKLIFN
jgi:hypothetical protein